MGFGSILFAQPRLRLVRVGYLGYAIGEDQTFLSFRFAASRSELLRKSAVFR